MVKRWKRDGTERFSEGIGRNDVQRSASERHVHVYRGIIRSRRIKKLINLGSKYVSGGQCLLEVAHYLLLDHTFKFQNRTAGE